MVNDGIASTSLTSLRPAAARRDVQNSIADLRSLLSMQLRNGMIPEMTFWGSDKVGCLPRFLQTLWYSNKRHTDITQTPVLPFALRSIWEATQASGAANGSVRCTLLMLVRACSTNVCADVFVLPAENACAIPFC